MPDMEISKITGITDFLNGQPYDCLGEVFVTLDFTDTLEFCGDYVFYRKTYPWERCVREPDSREEVHNIITNVILGLVDMTESDIDAMINDQMYIDDYY